MDLGGRVQQLVYQGLDSFAQLLFVPVTVQIRQLLAQPAPQPLHRHQIGAVGRQIHQAGAYGWLSRSGTSIWLVVSPLAHTAV